MDIRKSAHNHGYSLMELILAIAIVGTISAVAIPNYARYIASTREKICRINRQEILYEYQLYSLCEQEIPLSDYIRHVYEGRDLLCCPSGGLPAADGTGETAELTCSIHHDVISQQGAVSMADDIPFSDTLPSDDLSEILGSLSEN